MACAEMRKELERKLGRKLTEKEKKEIMAMHGHVHAEEEELLVAC